MKTEDEKLAARSRRAFLTMGVAGLAGFAEWSWLRSRSLDQGLPGPLRSVLGLNERLARGYFSDDHRMPEFARPAVNSDTRVNGDIGLGSDFDPATWKLEVQNGKTPQLRISLSEIQQLPRIEQITELNCIEGWTEVVHWTGVRFRDFTARYDPAFSATGAQYVRLDTPDEEYFVGLDAASALHPQTLLCFEMNGKPLTLAHGAPLRLVIPVKYGVKNLKRIGRITYTTDRPDDYWANQGYDWYAGL